MVLDQLVDLVVRPPRAEYEESDLLGPVLTVSGRLFKRHDVQLVNKRGHALECSHYRPVQLDQGEECLPCVIYCHGNSGCRADANDPVLVLLPLNITVLAMDFSGSGKSQGEHVSLGKFEMEDLETAIDYLRKEGLAHRVGLWGRSMGAVTALMYAAKDPTVAGVVADSPFSNLNNLILELVDFYKIPVPKTLVRLGVLPLMRRAIRQKAAFDINDLDPISSAPATFVSALFGHAEGDTFIQPQHSADIHEKYAGDKNRVTFPGDHNSPRPGFFYDSVAIFFHNVLEPPPNQWTGGSSLNARLGNPDDGAEPLGTREAHDEGQSPAVLLERQAELRENGQAADRIGEVALSAATQDAQRKHLASMEDLAGALSHMSPRPSHEGPGEAEGSGSSGPRVLHHLHEGNSESLEDDEAEDLARAVALSMQEAHDVNLLLNKGPTNTATEEPE